MKKLTLLFAVFALSIGTVQAAPLYGQIQLGGVGAYVTNAGGSKIGFDAGANGTGSGVVVVDPATTGIFASLFTVYNFGDSLNASNSGTMSDFMFSASSVSPLWTIGTISFSMTSFTAGPISSGFAVVGTGTITDSSTGGYSPVTGTFTMNTSSVANTAFRFDTTTVPEPGILALLGLGLLGMGAARIRARRS